MCPRKGTPSLTFHIFIKNLGRDRACPTGLVNGTEKSLSSHRETPFWQEEQPTLKHEAYRGVYTPVLESARDFAAFSAEPAYC